VTAPGGGPDSEGGPRAAAGLDEAGAERVREGVAAAIVGGPDGLRETLDSDRASFLALVAAARRGRGGRPPAAPRGDRGAPGGPQLGGDRAAARDEPLYLAVERSPQRWAHRRVTLPSRPTQRRLEQGGWTAVGTWFPFRYFKRALDAVAPADEAA